ncbi:MAG: V-type ATP synthase subunit E [Ruminiclostridium sp.]|nr:V-type ATP synthase subunit E [Ruminiclostridium sp.]
MSENKAKLDLLREEIEKCSEKEAKAIIEEAQKYADKIISETEGKLSSEMNGNVRKITDKFRNDERKRVSEICFSESKRVLLHRNNLTSEFFSKVEEKLNNAVDTARYTDYLADCVTKADDYITLDENTRVLCRECDTAALDTILKSKTCSLGSTDDIKIGGIIVSCPEKGILIDLTLDSALETERESFSSLKEMQL